MKKQTKPSLEYTIGKYGIAWKVTFEGHSYQPLRFVKFTDMGGKTVAVFTRDESTEEVTITNVFVVELASARKAIPLMNCLKYGNWTTWGHRCGYEPCKRWRNTSKEEKTI